jgi:hypothetical protein
VGATCSQNHCSQSCDGGTCPGNTQCVSDIYYLRTACFPFSCGGLPNNSSCARNDPYAGRCCNNACIDTNNDRNNCSSCGNACPSGYDCIRASCYPHVDCATDPADRTCKLDGGAGTCCGGQCTSIDEWHDRDNCGGCGIRCPVGDTCVNAKCVGADGGYDYCPSSSVCPPDTSCSPSKGRCISDTCGPGTDGAPCNGPGALPICCGGACVDAYADSSHCSACGRPCANGQFCDNGACKPTPSCTLQNSGVDCPLPGGGLGHCCSGSCVNFTTNAQSCGECGAFCPPGEVCRSGSCTLPDAGSASSCSGACPAGAVCDGNRCVQLSCPAGATGEACGFGRGVGSNSYATITGHCCNGACVDFTQDSHNCSACGTTCSGGLCVTGGFSSPSGSMCLSPPAASCGFMSCPANMYCTAAGCRTSACMGLSGGACQTSAGQSGTCCSQGFSSSCVDPASDVNNCGGCGISCGANATCNNGVCSNAVAPCTAGHLGQFCDLDAGPSLVCCPGGGCTDVRVDNKNCGRCGTACAGGLTCVSGACLALVCTTSTQNASCADDGGTSGNCCSGACVHKGTDPLNCGQCGRFCVGSETCVGGSCGVDVCDPSSQGNACHRDAGIYLSIGTCCSSACLDSRTDRNNCGGCGRVCPGDAGCVSGNCQ